MTEAGQRPSLHWAEIIAVGKRTARAAQARHHSLVLTERLNECGIEVRAKAVVGDRRDDLEAILRAALSRTELVVVCGGLGPTDDDLTRDASRP